MQNKISQAAKQWIGTPFHLHGRVKQVGCDCLGLIMGVADQLKIKTKLGTYLKDHDQTDYHLIHDGQFLEAQLDLLLEQSPSGELLLLEYDKNPQHLAIKVDNNTIIHAHLKQRKVVEHSIDIWIRNKIKKSYKLTQ